MRHIRKRATPLLLVVGLVGSLTATTPALADQKTDQAVRGPDAAAIAKIIDRIEEPSIPDRDYEITDFGAVGDGTTDALPAIRAAIERASADGGGRVVLPEGTWLSEGPVHLASNIDLHVSEGATLLFGTDTDDYLPVVRTRWEGTELDGYSPLIYGNDVHDVAITGSGTIDGIDVDSSTNVLIEENRFRTGDDSVVVKSGRDLDGRTIARPGDQYVDGELDWLS